MAQYNGYVSIPHETYDQWKVATLGNGYNVDYLYGNQCWDYCAELWHQYGLSLYTKPGGGGAADCWLVSRDANARSPFKAVYGKENIKRGDVLVFNRNPYSSVGHIAIADEDYRGNKIYTIAQIPGIYGINGTVHRYEESLTYFLGIFRNTKWETTPPTPTPTSRYKKNFPWAVAWQHWGW